MRTTVISKETKEQIERHRRFWVQVAEQYDWYTEPFYIQVWLDDKGDVADSVSHIGMTSDIIIPSL
ncbi:hypothetical protein A2791_01835 [Candidatus Saccharibacteria bacterium RIFCSPHIGHO2_01_FULL_46_30]|nr:MAG: hypothetical protein A2791_01835 [Candidatus Saccharibacteria bacterium RIFCSPHIGHO2_01_FULL_46_30]